MKIQDILKKQGEIYSSLTSNKTIQKCNETIEIVPYRNYMIPKREYRAITELEKLLNKKAIVNELTRDNFRISIQNNGIVYLKVRGLNLTRIPEEINYLQNLKELDLSSNQIQEIKNLDKLTKLQILDISNNQIKEIENIDRLVNLKILELAINQITEIKNLDKLVGLQELMLGFNQIKEIKGLNNLTSLKKLWLYRNQITEIKGLDNLQNLKELSFSNNQITKVKNLDSLQNLQEFFIYCNPIKDTIKNAVRNRNEIMNLRNKKIRVI